MKELQLIPMVSYSLLVGSNVYHKLKRCHKYVETTLSTTEDLVLFMASVPTLQRMAHSVEMPLFYIDKVASDGLHRLQNKYPSIRMRPEDLRGETMRQMVVLRGAGARKLEDFVREICRRRRRGTGFALRYFETIFIPKMSIYMDIVERKIDDYLPPIDQPSNDGAVADNRDEKVLSRIAYIPHTVHDRVVQRYHQYVLTVTFVDYETPRVNRCQLHQQISEEVDQQVNEQGNEQANEQAEMVEPTIESTIESNEPTSVQPPSPTSSDVQN